MRVTLSDIASALGVSKTTVSLALKNHPRISRAMREKIQKTAADLGYQPHPILSQIAAMRWKNMPHGPRTNVAFVTQRHPSPGFKNAFFEGAKEAAESMGYHMEEFKIGDYSGKVEATRVLTARGVEGVIISPIPSVDEVIELGWDAFSCIHIDTGLNDPPMHHVRPNYLRAAHQGWRMAIERDAPSIGFALIIEASGIMSSRDLAACEHISKYDPERGRIKSLLILEPWKYEPVVPWFRKHHPKMIITNNVGVYWELRGRGVKIPEDVEIICLNTWHEGNRMVSGFHLTHNTLGRAAMELLDGMIRRGERGVPRQPSSTVIDLEWHDGTTLREMPAAQGRTAKPA